MLEIDDPAIARREGQRGDIHAASADRAEFAAFQIEAERFRVLSEKEVQKLRETRAGAMLPTIVCTSRDLDARDRETLLSLDVAAISKSDLSHEVLCDAILRTLGRVSGADSMANRLDAGAA